MHRVFGFRPGLRIEILDEERVFVLGERERFLLTGRAHVRVASWIDGIRTVREIIAALEAEIWPPETYYALEVLLERGFITEVTAELAQDAAAFWHGMGVDARQAAQRLAATPVEVMALDGLDPGPLYEALTAAGVHVQGTGATLRVVLVEDYLNPALDGLNREALARGTPWMLVKLAGTMPWVGPVLQPGAGPCWACLAFRVQDNRPVERYLQRQRGAAGPIVPRSARLAASVTAHLHLTALALARWITGDPGALLGNHLLALDLARLAFEHHAVVRRPQCAACGDPGMQAARGRAPVRLAVAPRRFTEDGGHRTVPPEDTLARLSQHISPITGIVSSLGPVKERDHPLRPVYGAAYRICPVHDAPGFDDFHRVALGKGRTAVQARASALCEAIERHSAVFVGDEPRVRARLADLGDEAIHPDELQNFSEAQLRDREAWNASAREARQRVPLPFDPEVAIEWTPVWSLTQECRRYVPTAYCYASVPVPAEERFCSLNPNGHAAGNCLEEAILQAFFELVERDGAAIWWYNRLRRPAVDLASFDEPYFQSLEVHYRALGYRVYVLDLTTELEIPTFVALARAEGTGRYCLGFGCHAEARLGVQRALTELNQLFQPGGNAPTLWDPASLDDTAFLDPDDSQPARLGSDAGAARRSENLRDDIHDCVARAARAGLETLVLDQTRPDVELCVAKVIVPGLRHFWPRLGPGRLYDVPVRLGLRSSPLAEADLNPVPLYL
jgi:oxazoline/thiazoline synthase